MGSDTTSDRVRGYIERMGFAYEEIAARVAEDTGIAREDANFLVDRLREGRGCAVAVAIAVIGLAHDQAMIDRGHMPARS